MGESIESSYTESFFTPVVQVNKNVPYGPYRKSRIPVLIKKPIDNKPVNIQLMRAGSAKSDFSSTRDSTEFLKREEFPLNKSLRKGNFVENGSLKRNRDVCRQHKKLDCIRDRENKVSYFPSYGSHPLLVDWDSRLKNADSKTSPRLEDDVLFDQTAKLLEKISGFFSQKGKNDSPESRSSTTVSSNDDSRHQACVDPYVDDILKGSLEKEVHYSSLFKKKFTVAQEEQRRNIIQRVARLSLTLKVHHDIVHLAIFIIDAFLQMQKCTAECCSLLAVTAFLIASKLESQSHHSIERLVRLSNFKYHEKEVRWMEKLVLYKLSFDICPPTSQHFLELCISQLDFPNEHIKSLVIDLSSAMLIRSISDIQHISLKASLKAQTAALVATEYIMFHKNTIMKRFGVAHPKKIEYSLFFESAVTKCYQLFQTLILGSENETHDGRNATPSLARNKSVKGMIKLASSSHCILVK